jgi:hypothetical protein
VIDEELLSNAVRYCAFAHYRHSLPSFLVRIISLCRDWFANKYSRATTIRFGFPAATTEGLSRPSPPPEPRFDTGIQKPCLAEGCGKGLPSAGAYFELLQYKWQCRVYPRSLSLAWDMVQLQFVIQWILVNLVFALHFMHFPGFLQLCFFDYFNSHFMYVFLLRCDLFEITEYECSESPES